MLHVGDLVMTHSGTPVEITWIGQRQVDLRRHPKPENVRPVRIRAGAFAPTVPARDLLVSPDHAIFIANPGEPGGVLVPARYLINGATVVQDANCPRAHYFHVELPAHDVLLAEGLPTESYLDTGNRDQFAGAAVPALHPDFTPRFWADACAPLCLSGPAVARTRLALLVRAEQLGYRRERVELSLQVGSRRLLPAIIRNDIVSFVLPAGTRMVRLTTRVAAPADTDHKSNDHRQLGVAIAGILFNGCSLALDGEAIGEGFYPPEGGWRWTNGDACLFLPAVATRRSLVLNLRVTGYATCWTAPSSLTVKQKKRS
jgi:hypothetical protein